MSARRWWSSVSHTSSRAGHRCSGAHSRRRTAPPTRRHRRGRHICPADARNADRSFRQHRRQRIARSQRLHPLAVAARVQLGRVDATQTHARGDSMPGQRRTRATKVSLSMTRNTSAGWPLRSAAAAAGSPACGAATAALCRTAGKQQRAGTEPGREGGSRQQQRAAALRVGKGLQRYEHSPGMPPDPIREHDLKSHS